MLVLSTETPAAIAIVARPQTTATLCPTLCRNIAGNRFDSVVVSPNYQFDIITMSKVEFNTTGYLLDSVVSVVMSLHYQFDIITMSKVESNTTGYLLDSVVSVVMSLHYQFDIITRSKVAFQHRGLSTQ